jgi:hypothetical protein
VSPNPGGKRKYPQGEEPEPKVTAKDIRELARSHCHEAIAVAVECMRTGDKVAERLSAARLVLEYGLGRPGLTEPEQSTATVGAELVELFRRPPVLASCPAESPTTEHEPIAQDSAVTLEASG